MSTRTVLSTIGRLATASVIVFLTSGCGGELLRTGRSPVYLVVTAIDTKQGGGTGNTGTVLQSDVSLDDGTVFNDNVTLTIRAELKNPLVAATAINNVTISRYRVNFRRSDGRNTPGVDVPYGFDGAVAVTIPAGAQSDVSLEIVRHQSKLEPPLKNISAFNAAGDRSLGGAGFLSVIADVTVWGRDQNGNEVTATASIDVHFGQFGDS